MHMTHRRQRRKAPAAARRAERGESVAEPDAASGPDRDAGASDRWARLLLPMIATAVVLGVALGVAITRSGLAPGTRAILGLLLALALGLLLWRLGWRSRRREP